MSAAARSSRRRIPPEYVLTVRSCFEQVELLQELLGPAVRLRAGKLVQPAEHPQVLAPGEVLVHRSVLARQPDDRPDLLRLSEDVETAHARPPGIRPEERGQDADRGGLAGSVRPEQAQDRPFIDGQVEAVERAHLVLARAIDLGQETLPRWRAQAGIEGRQQAERPRMANRMT